MAFNVILVKSVFNKDKNNYYYNIFLEKASHELPRKPDVSIGYHDLFNDVYEP